MHYAMRCTAASRHARATLQGATRMGHGGPATARRGPWNDVEPFVIHTRNCKSLWNYATHVRPQVDRGDDPAFFLNSEGRRFNPTKLGIDLGRLGRQVWPQFVPYTMRRLFTTRFLIQNGFNVYVTAQRLGDTVATVEKHYLEKARARAAMRGLFRIRRYRGRSA